MADPVMIMVAPNGARRMKSDHPALPITPQEVAEEAGRCRDAGASAIHVHVRDAEGAHVLDAARYAETRALIEVATGGDMVVQITTEAVGVYTPQQQMNLVRETTPQCVSLALKELVPDDGMEAAAGAFFSWMKAERIAPQFILYEPAEVERFFSLREKGVIPFANPFLLFVLGRYTAGQQSDPAGLDAFLDVLGERTAPWSLCAFGAREADCAEAAIAAGGHVRVGFENNLHLPDGSLARSNADLVSVVADRGRALGRKLMSGETAAAFIKRTAA